MPGLTAAVPAFGLALPEIVLAFGALALVLLGAIRGDRSVNLINGVALALLDDLREHLQRDLLAGLLGQRRRRRGALDGVGGRAGLDRQEQGRGQEQRGDAACEHAACRHVGLSSCRVRLVVPPGHSTQSEAVPP